jgi:glycine cleavage system regulatory protein
MGIPLPASTQWELVEQFGIHIAPIDHELVRQAAQLDVFHNDDTKGRVLSLMGTRAEGEASEHESGRTGIFTTSILATSEQGPTIALFRTGTAHAGENLEQVLGQRDPERDPPIQMCDGLERNLPNELATIVANCMAHGRRHFVEQEENFPDGVGYVLEELAIVYKVEAESKKEADSLQQRLERHQNESKPAMDRLHDWCKKQLDEKQVEPNSGLGAAIRYMLDRWERLTKFLHVPGAPLDNNICEQALKRSIQQRKNSLFYKTLHGAEIGDRFMSLIHTCMLNNVDPVHYLTTIARHTAEIAQDPAAWMPWNYTEALRPEPPPSGPD